MSQEYIGALVVLLMSILKILNIDLATDEVTAIVTGIAGAWVAYRRYKKGDITVMGARK